MKGFDKGIDGYKINTAHTRQSGQLDKVSEEKKSQGELSTKNFKWVFVIEEILCDAVKRNLNLNKYNISDHIYKGIFRTYARCGLIYLKSLKENQNSGYF